MVFRSRVGRELFFCVSRDFSTDGYRAGKNFPVFPNWIQEEL